MNFVDPDGRDFLGIECPFGKNDDGGCKGAYTAREVVYTAGVDALAGCAGGAAAGAAFTGGPGVIPGCGIGFVGGATEGAVRGLWERGTTPLAMSSDSRDPAPPGPQPFGGRELFIVGVVIVLVLLATAGITNLAIRFAVVVVVSALVGAVLRLWRARR